MSEKLKGLLTVWHTPHQFDLITALKDYVQFDILVNTNKHWLGRPTPAPEQTRFVANYTPGYYDFAILNLDQQVINENIYKSQIYPQLNSVITDIPKIVLQHGSPVYPEYVATNGMDWKDAEKKIIEYTKKLVGDNTMVVNSYTSASDSEWGFGHPIVHGMDTEMWGPAETKELKVITALSPAGCDVYYNRQMLDEVMAILEQKYSIRVEWARRNVKFDSTEEYAQWLGKSLIYLDTSYRTPMNRARTEAMLSGCAVVQVEGAHDLDRFFHPGEDIYLTPQNSPDAMAELVADLFFMKHDEVLQVGKNARENAFKQFNYDRYSQDWMALLKQLGIAK